MGFNAQTEVYENLVKAGVIDPTKVVRTALQDAASVAGLLITTEAAVSEAPEDKPAGRRHAAAAAWAAWAAWTSKSGRSAQRTRRAGGQPSGLFQCNWQSPARFDPLPARAPTYCRLPVVLPGAAAFAATLLSP